MEVVAAHLDPLAVVGEAEADHGALGMCELEHVLVAHHLRQRPVWRALAGDGTRLDQLELAVDTNRESRGATGHVPV